MSETLYRKYRPQRFADVTEQQHVVQTLCNQLAHGLVAHAYLFSGPRGVGKTTIARLLAKAVNCTGRAQGTSEPCNTCSACTAFAQGRYMDTVEMDAASQTGVDNVRDNIVENVRFLPQLGGYKVFIIDEVHMLSGPAFNALLKTLEEPPAHALFILATTELYKIPATIVSRCQRFDFHRISVKDMTERLARLAKDEGVTVDDDVLQAIARLSEGCLRDAESLLGQVLAVGGDHVSAQAVRGVLPATNVSLCVSLTTALAGGDLPGTLAALNAFVNDGGSMKHLVDELIEYIRTMLFAALGSTERGAYDAKTHEALVADAAKLGAQETRRLLDLVLTARARPTLALLPQLPLEIAFAEFFDRETSTPSPRPLTNAPVLRSAPQVAPRSVDAPSPTTSSTAPLPTAKLSFTVEDLQAKWERCCTFVAERSTALPLVLQSATPTAVEGNMVTLRVAYGFHADTMREQKNIRLVEDAIAEVMMERPVVKTVVDAQRQDDPAASLAAAFGGAVIG